jgi:RimJ/RimL family protein N-acetyltransferase
MFSWRRPELIKPREWHSFKTRNPKTSEIEEFIVQDLPRERFADSLNFMLEHFLPYEPICKIKSVTNDADALKEICELWSNVLEQNVVIACFKKNCSELVGLNMVCVITRKDFEHFKLDVRKDNTWKAVHDFALVNFNLFSKYKFADKILIAYGLSVSKDYRQRGIATEILRARIPLCRSLDVPLTSTVFTAIGSQKPAEKIGFQVDYEITYKKLSAIHEELDLDGLDTSSLKLMSLVIDKNQE